MQNKENITVLALRKYHGLGSAPRPPKQLLSLHNYGYAPDLKIRAWLKPISGRVDRASATETVDLGSIPSRVKPKTIKIGIHSFPA